MTEDNRGRNVDDELARAEVCLAEARVLCAGALPYGAASRAYYAAFHAAQALLYSAGLEARTHHGVVLLVGTHFVRPGHLSAELGRVISRLQRDREDADYNIGAVFTDQEARAAIEDAERLLSAVRGIVAPTTLG